MANNLKKTLKIEDEEYNINAVYSDEAGKVSNSLTLKSSNKDGTNTDTVFNGSEGKEISYVPSDGGTFTGSVYLDHDKSKVDSIPDDNEVITSAQVSNRVAELNGAPFFVWNTQQLYELKDTTDSLYKFNTIVGSEADFYTLKNSLVEGDSSKVNYTLSNTLSPVIAHWIADSLDSDASGVIVIPSSYTGTYNNSTYTKAVKEVNAIFRKNTKVTSVVLPDSITEIKGQTFQDCTALTSIVIPDNITTMSSNAIFDGCTSLKSVKLSKNITTLGIYAFRNCKSLTSIVIPQGVTSIGKSAFSGCTQLTSIVIPKSLKTIDESAFADCDNLTKVYYEGDSTDWSLISIAGYNESLTHTSVERIYNYIISDPIISGDIISIGAISTGPFIYICKDEETTTLPTSNKIFLKLPDDDNIVEISKGAVRLNSTSTASQDFYTYEGLAEIIARINTRLDGLGVGVNTTELVAAPLYIPQVNELLPEELQISEDIDPEAIPTITDLTKAIAKVTDNTDTSLYKTTNWEEQSPHVLEILTKTIDENPDSLASIRADLNDLIAEVTYELEQNPENPVFAAESRIDKIENGTTTLDGVKIAENGTLKIGGFEINKTKLGYLLDLVDSIDWGDDN